VLGVRNGMPIFIRDIGKVVDGAEQIERMVLFGEKSEFVRRGQGLSGGNHVDHQECG